ncbi:hypothetical protein D3C78_1366990 [compost metagenome]
MAGVGHHGIADGQYQRTQHDHALGAQYFIPKPATDGDKTIDQRAEGGEQGDRVGFAQAQHLDQINRHDALQTVITKTFPELNREDQVKRLGLFEGIETNAFRVFAVVVCC